jgi:hypothetical protein
MGNIQLEQLFVHLSDSCLEGYMETKAVPWD